MLGILAEKTKVNQQLLDAIHQVSSEFEKVYTNINKFTCSVTEGTEQMTSHVLNLKRKLHDLRKVLLQQPANVTADAAAKNSELIKIQEKIRSLKGQGKTEEIPPLEKKMDEINEQFKNLMSPDAALLQKSAICRSIVGIVDTLGQIVFRTVSDQFSVRDAIKSYLISTVDAKKLAGGGKKEKKEEKGTVERMSAALLKSAGVFLDFGKQVGLELPAEYESQVKGTTLTQNGVSPTPPTIAELTKKIDTQVRTLNSISRNEKDVDALIADELLKDADELINTMKSVEVMTNYHHNPVQQAVKESQAAINVAEYEADPANFKVPPIRSIEEAIAKLKIMIKVLHNYLVPSLVATPLVYLQDADWAMKSHSEFRAARRKELKDLEPHVTPSMPLDALRECITEFGQTLTQVLHVKIPAMREVHPDDSSIFTRTKWAPERQAMRDEIAAELDKLQNAKTKNSPPSVCNVVQTLLRLMMKFLTYKPVGRPHVFRSDAEWTLVSESKLRFQLRKELLL